MNDADEFDLSASRKQVALQLRDALARDGSGDYAAQMARQAEALNAAFFLTMRYAELRYDPSVEYRAALRMQSQFCKTVQALTAMKKEAARDAARDKKTDERTINPDDE